VVTGILVASQTGATGVVIRGLLFTVEGVVVSLLIDTLQKRRRELLAAKQGAETAQLLMEGIVQTAPSAIVATEPDGTLFLFNRAAERLTGYSYREVAGKSLLDLFVPEEWRVEVTARFRSPDPAVLQQPHRNPWRTRSGEERLIEWRCAVLPSDGGNRIVGVGVDVTDLQKMEQEREALAASEREAYVRAEAATRAKDRFLATITHELRGPLTAILGWTQLLARSAEHSDAVAGGLRVIEENAHAQARLVDDLLDYARMATGKTVLERRPVKVDDVVRSAIDAFVPVAEEKKVQIRPLFDTDNAVVDGDERRLRQVFVNVLQNAVRYTDTGYIDVRAERVNDHVRILIRDTGRGIDAEFLPYVFDKFTQGSDAGSSNGSLGLGLAIVKELVTMHGGRIEATSDGPGRGATFAIDLPVAS
jgi:PAS domain S-box-containing protein